jgi:hypothetical protein
MLADLALAIADAATSISDLRARTSRPSWRCGSVPTIRRTLQAVDTAALEGIASARAKGGTEAWVTGIDPGFDVVNIDAMLVGAHSEKEGTAPN